MMSSLTLIPFALHTLDIPGKGEEILSHLSFNFVVTMFMGLEVGFLNVNDDFEVLGTGSKYCVLVVEGCIHML